MRNRQRPGDLDLRDLAAILGHGYLRLHEIARRVAVFHVENDKKRLDVCAHRSHCHDDERAPRRRACSRA